MFVFLNSAENGGQIYDDLKNVLKPLTLHTCMRTRIHTHQIQNTHDKNFQV